MSKPMPWFRFYSEAIRDTKLRRIARTTNTTLAEVLGIWAIILSFAGESPERGSLVLSGGNPITEDDISDAAGCNVSETLQELQRNGMIIVDEGVISIAAWSKRQYDSDNSTKRVQAYRNKVKDQENATLQEQPRNVSETAPELNTELDVDLKIIPASPEPQPKRQREPNPHWELAEAIGDVCGTQMSIKSNQGKLLKCAADLKRGQPPATADQVREHYGISPGSVSWWYREDWRGQKGDRPNLASIRDTWGKWLLPSTPKTGGANGTSSNGLAAMASRETYSRARQPTEEERAAVLAVRNRKPE